MHKTSKPKFHIPYNDPRFQPMPNFYAFEISTSTVQTLESEDCVSEERHLPTQQHCFKEKIEAELGCKLLWDTECPICQFPFEYKGKTYTQCIDEDSARKWCPTAKYFDGSVVPDSWAFCPQECDYKNRTKGKCIYCKALILCI